MRLKQILLFIKNMARTLEEIQQVIQQAAASFPELSDMETNPSTVQVWKYAKRVMALGIRSVEEIVDVHKQEVEANINTQAFRGLDWYKDKVLQYQHGDSLVVAANQVVYPAIDPTKRIIAQVAIVESQTNGSLEIKVAKDANGLTALSADELAGLQTYLNRIKIAGTLVTTTSGNAVLVRYNVNVEVDKLVLNGQAARIDGTTTTPVQEALEAFHQSLEFNGTLFLSKATNAVQDVEGIIDVELTATYSDGVSWLPITRKLLPTSGYVSLYQEMTTINVLN